MNASTKPAPRPPIGALLPPLIQGYHFESANSRNYPVDILNMISDFMSRGDAWRKATVEIPMERISSYVEASSVSVGAESLLNLFKRKGYVLCYILARKFGFYLFVLPYMQK